MLPMHHSSQRSERYVRTRTVTSAAALTLPIGQVSDLHAKGLCHGERPIDAWHLLAAFVSGHAFRVVPQRHDETGQLDPADAALLTDGEKLRSGEFHGRQANTRAA